MHPFQNWRASVTGLETLTLKGKFEKERKSRMQKLNAGNYVKHVQEVWFMLKQKGSEGFQKGSTGCSWGYGMGKELYNWLFHPTVRLATTLPWSAEKIGKTYAVGLTYYCLGSMIPLVLLVVALYFGVQHAPLLVLAIIGTDTQTAMPLILAVTAASFVAGFGLELWYINSQMSRDGLRLADVVGLNLKSLNNSPKTAILYSLVALAIGLTAQSILSLLPVGHEPKQAAASLAQNLTGVPLLGFICLVAIAAPIVEEIVFRGFVFNAVRAALSNGAFFQSFLLGSQRMVDWLAVCGSALVFAAAHLEPSAFLHLFVLGVILAELYRRSGTLICPMLLHTLNNLSAVALLLMR